ncbi:urease accessory protein UreD [Actinoplanes regularis]|uniref:Urease accessory protein UreD n=1 Tax=Actinoplanes regularis TaxID=52697 RepID=A0A239EF12_9ACTN|nr:urease accessory protein UreD [Actinoplanes regularis]GIE89167.1 urease accessory protein UreD [Actinoplanes regularis]SNS43226.1 urease accessory protein [Actinoplanes regularis]
MKAEARVVAESDGLGGTRLAVLRGQSPLLLRQTGPRVAGGVTVHLVGGAAGPLRGDELRLDIEVGPGAWLELLSVAAQLALPGRPAPASRLTINATVAAGGTLRWIPEPLIAAAGCDHLAITRVAVAAGGALLWRDDLVCGRHGEDPGDFVADTLIRYDGSTLHRHELAVGPRAAGWNGAAVLGDARALGTVVTAGPATLTAGSATPNAAVMPLAGPGLLATAVDADIRAVRAVLDPFCAAHPTAKAPVPA